MRKLNILKQYYKDGIIQIGKKYNKERKIKMRPRCRYVIISIISIIFVGCLFCRVVLAEDQNVVMSIYPKPKIDIVLAKSRTSTNLDDFENQMKNSLRSSRSRNC